MLPLRRRLSALQARDSAPHVIERDRVVVDRRRHDRVWKLAAPGVLLQPGQSPVELRGRVSLVASPLLQVLLYLRDLGAERRHTSVL